MTEVVELHNSYRNSSKSFGVSADEVPSSININASRIDGSRAYVDKQSSFVIGEGSSLHVGTVENTGAIIGKEGNSTFKIDTYVGKDIQNYDTMTTTGGSIGASLGGNPKITNVGFNQDSRDKQGITRNTVVEDVEIEEAEGSPINRDLGKANEVTKDTHSSTNINIESQTIEYATNPGKLKEDIGKAKEEINDIKWAIKESIHDRGDDNRNFFGQLSERRLATTINNIGKERFQKADTVGEITDIFKSVYKDLGYDVDIIYSDPEHAPQLIGKDGKARAGRAYVDEKGRKTIIVNMKSAENWTKSGLIGTISEEGSHVIGKVEGRQRKTGTDEKGLESTGKATNEYFKEQYRDNDKPITPVIDGKNYTGINFGEHVGDREESYEGWLRETVVYADPNQNFIVHKYENFYKVVYIGNEEFLVFENEEMKKEFEKEARNLGVENVFNTMLETEELKKSISQAESQGPIISINKVPKELEDRGYYISEDGNLQNNKTEKNTGYSENSYAVSEFENEPTLGERISKAASGGLKILKGGVTTLGGGTLIAASAGVDYVTVGATAVPSFPVKVGGWTAVVMGLNKVGSGFAEVGDAIFGDKKKVTGESFNPIRDTVFKNVPELYDTADTIVEIGVLHISPIVSGFPEAGSGKSEISEINKGNSSVDDNISKMSSQDLNKENINPIVSNLERKSEWNIGNGSLNYTAVKNSEGNYTPGRTGEWNINTVTSVEKSGEVAGNLYKVEINDGMIPGYTLIGNKEPVQNTPNEVIKPDKDSQGINTELHQKINNREEGHYYKLQQQKNIESTGLPNYSIKPLTDIKDPALNVDKVRSYLEVNKQKYIKKSYKMKDVSVATAKVTTKDGKVENILSVSGRAWNGNAPKEVTIDNVRYKVIIKDSESVKTYTGISQNGNIISNLNHAEKKLASYIQDNYSGKEVKVDIGVQNTSIKNSGMCTNCNSSMFDFAKDNPDMRITIYEGTTGINP